MHIISPPKQYPWQTHFAETPFQKIFRLRPTNEIGHRTKKINHNMYTYMYIPPFNRKREDETPPPTRKESEKNGKKRKERKKKTLTSPATSLARSVLSISIICCSSTNAIAQGTPTINTLAVRTYNPLPPHQAPLLTKPVICIVVVEMRRRVPGDKISLSAYIRSDIVSDGNKGGRDDVDIEESVFRAPPLSQIKRKDRG